MFTEGTAVAVVAAAQDATPAVTGRRQPHAKRLPLAKDTPASPYAPGALRAATDAERGRMAVFCAEHPEYERALGYEGLRQIAATYLDDGDRAARGELRAGGVPMGWRRIESDDVNPSWSDDS